MDAAQMLTAVSPDEGRHDLEVRDRRFNPPLTTIAIGTVCIWHDAWERAGGRPLADAERGAYGPVEWLNGEPWIICCPHCGGPVEKTTMLDARRELDLVQQQAQSMRYLYEFFAWCRGRCYPKGDRRALDVFFHDLGVTREVMFAPPEEDA